MNIKEKIKFINERLSMKVKVNLLVMVVLLIIIWWLLPHLKINNSYPFKNFLVSFLISLLMVFLMALKVVIEFVAKNKDKTVNVIGDWITLNCKKVALFIGVIYQRLQYNYRDIKYKVTQDHQQQKLCKLPWYLVLGSAQSGKKSILKNTELNYIRPERFCDEAVKYVNEMPSLSWWFSDQAIFIDAMTDQKDTDHNVWNRLIKQLKRVRKQNPLNGILLTLSLPELMLMSNKDRQAFIQSIGHYIKDIHTHFNALVPVYIIFNKCDLIEGFTTFFHDLSKEELRQVWGMTLPIEQCHDYQFVSQFFDKEYMSLIEQLNRRVLWTLDSESSARGRELIHKFPQQMQLMKLPIETFIAELFGTVHYPKALQIRGFYFTSCEQDMSEPYDFILKAMSKKFQLVPPIFQRQPKMSESYFTKKIFRDVIYPEYRLLGHNEKNKRNKEIKYNIILAACPIILALSFLMMHQGYQDNLHKLMLVDNKLNYYDKAYANIQMDNDSLINILPALDQVYQSSLLYNNANIYASTLFATHYINKQLHKTFERTLRVIFLPRVAAQLQNKLNQNIQDSNLLYATLKAYLAFSDHSHVINAMVKPPMQIEWKKNYINTPATEKKLNNYLNLALNNKLDKFPVNIVLINRMQENLEQIVPSDRAYGLLKIKSIVSDSPTLLLDSASGKNYNTIFSSDQAKTKIPGLYTKNGLETVFIPMHSKIAEEVKQDNSDIGLDNDIIQSSKEIDETLQKQYTKDYIANWNAALKTINIKPFNSLSQSIVKLNVLIDKNSPLTKLLIIIYNNTEAVHDDNRDISESFQPINNFSKKEDNKTNLKNTMKVLKSLRDYLMKIEQSKNQEQASFDAIESMIQGEKTPIQQLSTLAKEAPFPINKWLTQLSDNAWEVLIIGAHKQMNETWSHEVIQNYLTYLKGRYPLNANSNSQISITNFNNFFGFQGNMSQYFIKYIKPFVNTEVKPWKLYQVGNHTAELTNKTIKIFERMLEIQAQFFASNSKEAKINFVIKPLTLASNAENVHLTVGEHELNYSHGPQQNMAITWPLPLNEESANISINDFNDKQHIIERDGPWAIFKLFDQGMLHSAASTGVYFYRVDIDGYSCTYEIMDIDNLSILKLKALKGYDLPIIITSSKGDIH